MKTMKTMNNKLIIKIKETLELTKKLVNDKKELNEINNAIQLLNELIGENVLELLEKREEIEKEIKMVDNTALVKYEIERRRNNY